MERLTELADHGFAYAVLDKERRVRQADRVLAALLATTAERLINQDISGYLPEVANFDFGQQYQHRQCNKEGWDCCDLELYRLDAGLDLYLLTLKNITHELKQIVSENSLYRRMINAISDGIHITDGKGTVLYFNDSFMELSGIKLEETMNRNLYELQEQLVPHVASQSISLLVLETQQPQTIMVEYNRTKKRCLVTGTPVLISGRIVLVVSISRDITELNLLRDKIAAADFLNLTYKQKLKEMEAKTANPVVLNTKSKVMRDIYDTAIKVAPVDIPVLILGETGVGKDTLAKFIHDSSDRSQGHLIKLNCAAIPEQLLESELFGYEPGAFTGASKQGKAGQMELANGGTLFLDEIGEMPQNMQAKVLSAIQDKKIYRVGGTKSININARILAATNADLPQRVKGGLFRQDLYFRLNVIQIRMPPLRNRQEDILSLAATFLQDFSKKYKKSCYFSPLTAELLCRHPWPGNIRELRNTIERVVILTEHDCIEPDVLAANILGGDGEKRPLLPTLMIEEGLSLKQRMGQYEALILKETINKHKNLTRTAWALGIDFSTLMRKKKKHCIS